MKIDLFSFVFASVKSGRTAAYALIGLGTSSLVASAGTAGKLSRELWIGLNGPSFPGLQTTPSFPGAPNSTSLISGVEPASNAGDNYGERLRGWITPAVSGNYTFWVSGDEDSQLWLSTNASKFGKQRIAWFAGNTSPRQWTKFATQQSATIALVAGQKYYVEILHKESTGGDHVSIGWQPPGASAPVVVPASVIESFSGDPADVDDDDLPDAWEISMGLSATAGTGQIGDNGKDGDPDKDGFTNFQEWLAGTSPTTHNSIAGGLTREIWQDIAGSAVANLTASPKFLNKPVFRDFIPGADAEVNLADSYGQRLRGYVVIPATGNYRFYIAGDDATELWLAENGSHYSRRKVAWNTGSTGRLQWTASSTQASVVLTLVQGQRVYLEALHKENGGGDHLSIGWSVNAATPVLVPAQYLEAFATPLNDADEDLLEDSWELTYGFHVGDNGVLYPNELASADPDNDGFSNFLESITQGSPLAAGGNVGYAERDIWTGIPDSKVSSLTASPKFVQTPDVSQLIGGNLDFGNYADNYGQRIRGVIVPPRSGNWRFSINADDSAEFWLSDSASASGKKKVALVDELVAAGNYDALTAQKSKWIYLQAGQSYYYEILHKESLGADRASVVWEFQSDNWALATAGSTATQSSTNGTSSANLGIDGSTAGASGGVVTQTKNTAGSWWQVDLGQSRLLNRVVLFNRTDALSNQQQLSNFRVSALDASGNELAGQNFYTTSGYVQGSLIWNLPSAVSARKIRVQSLGTNLAGNNYLGLAELQVFNWVSESDRQIVAAPFLRVAAPDPLDLDDDSLPDAWENLKGLNGDDNGSVNSANGEYGDPDHDRLTNLQEYQLGTDPLLPSSAPGFFALERWEGIPGYSVANLFASPKIHESPDAFEFRTPDELKFKGQYFGTRSRGYVTPSTTGDYTFWLSARTSAELWLSSDDVVGKYAKRRIALVDPSIGSGNGIGFLDENLWDSFAAQKSAAIHLEAGKHYYVEIVQMNAHSSSPHSSILWALNGGARVPVPGNAAASYIATADDGDDDFLPDAWEISHGLSASDNGLIDPARQGERGDFDQDGLTNREEYLLGSDPANADSDGDGLSDYDEVKTYGTNPNANDLPEETLVATLPVDGFAAASNQWLLFGDGLISDNFRGQIEWDFTTTTPGVWILQLGTQLRGTVYDSETVDMNVFIDGVFLGRYPVEYGATHQALLRIISPQLALGSHRLKLDIDNKIARRSVQINSLELRQPTGSDANTNGVPDWVEVQLAQTDKVKPHEITSLTSPYSLEGNAKVSSAVRINGNAPLEGTDDAHWYYNLPLDPATATNYTTTFASGLAKSGEITWQATNVLEGDSLVVRDGDSLKLGAWTEDGSGVSTITINTSNRDGVVTGPVTSETANPQVGSGAARFTGNAYSYITLPDNDQLDGGDQFTISFWAKPTATGVDGLTRGLVSKRVSANNQVAYSVFLASGGKLNVEIDNGASTPTRIDTGYVMQQNWQAVAVVFDGTLVEAQRIKVYVNGVLKKTASHPYTSIANRASDLFIGSQNANFENGGGPASFDGWLDDIQIYRAALSASQVAALFGSSTPFAGLVARFDFEDAGALASETAAPQVVYNVTGHDTVAHAFTKGRVYTIDAAHSSSASGQLVVTALRADLPAPMAVLQDSLSDWTLATAKVDPSLVFEPGVNLRLGDRETIDASQYRYRVYPEKGGKLGIAVRLWAGGPIAGIGRLESVALSDALKNDNTSSSAIDYFSGYHLTNSTLLVTDLPAGGSVKVTINRAGLLFLDGTTVKTFTAADFINGVLQLTFLEPDDNTGGFCHTIDLYDATGKLIVRH